MTCREKLKRDHPEDYETLIVDTCPSYYGYLDDPKDDHGLHNCNKTLCSNCWDREIKEPAKVIKENPAPTIKDSGDRTQFESGAVRDMREGKGRCDLMPLEVVARMRGNVDGKQNMFDYIVHFLNTNQTHHLVKALEKFAEEAYGNPDKQAICTMFLEVAKHFEDGAKKYGPDNWRRGIPTYCYIDSAVRHYLKWLRGDKDEPHDRAFVWNLMCCIWEVDYHKKESEE